MNIHDYMIIWNLEYATMTSTNRLFDNLIQHPWQVFIALYCCTQLWKIRAFKFWEKKVSIDQWQPLIVHRNHKVYNKLYNTVHRAQNRQGRYLYKKCAKNRSICACKHYNITLDAMGSFSHSRSFSSSFFVSSFHFPGTT